MAVNQKRVEECRITPVKYGRWYQSYKIPKQKTTVKEADEKKQNKWKTTSFSIFFFNIFLIFFYFPVSRIPKWETRFHPFNSALFPIFLWFYLELVRFIDSALVIEMIVHWFESLMVFIWIRTQTVAVTSWNRF